MVIDEVNRAIANWPQDNYHNLNKHRLLRCPKFFFRSVEISIAIFRRFGFRFARRCTVVRNTFARERHFSDSPIQYVGLSEKSLSFYEEVIDAQGFLFFIILFCRDKHCDVSRTWF